MKKILVFLLIAVTSLAGASFADGSPDSFTSMALEANAKAASFAPNSGPVYVNTNLPTKAATVTFFNDQAAFTAAAPGLTLEDFEGGAAGPGQVLGCPSPLSNSSPGTCFASGDLVDGFSFNTTNGQVVALGAGIVPVNPTTWVAADLFNAGSSFQFTDSNVLAVGFELFSFANSPITVSVYGAGGALLGTAIHPAGATFFGVKTDETITQISMTPGVPIYDNLQFGTGIIDTDGDGIGDDDDACVNSDLNATVVIDSCDSGVDNTLGSDGCTISDLVAMCVDGANNHGQYVRCVSHLTNDLKKAGEISGSDKGAITSCAGQADLP